MKTQYRTFVWSSWWCFVLLCSGATWGLVSDWLDPKPAWSVSADDTLQLSHYQPRLKLLTGYRLKEPQTMDLVVMDAVTGRELASLTVPFPDIPNKESLRHVDWSPHLFGDSVLRFAAGTTIAGEFEVQLRSWKYVNSQQESILARWHIPVAQLDAILQQQHQQDWLHCVWSPDEAGVALVYQYLPTDEMLRGMLAGFSPDVTLGYTRGLQYWFTSTWLTEVWRRDNETKSFQRETQYTLSAFDRAVSNRGQWSMDGHRYATVKSSWRGSKPTIRWINVVTGQIQLVMPAVTQPQVIGVQVTGNLLMTQSHQVVPQAESGRLLNGIHCSPSKRGTSIWSIDVWRTLFDAQTLTSVKWPAALDESIIGVDRLLVDGADPTRFLYHSNVWDESPYWRAPSGGGRNSYFVFLRYLDGQFKIEHQWHHDDWNISDEAALCGQLFVECSQGIEISDSLLKVLLRFPWLY